MIDHFREEYFFLSNFYPYSIAYDGLTYTSVEAAYQSLKTLDLEERQLFTQYDARTAKRAGNELKAKGLVRKDWGKIKLSIMHNLLIIKFADPALKLKLFNTGDEELVEGNTWNDVYYGVCDGKGKNHLGKLLMKVREYYRCFE